MVFTCTKCNTRSIKSFSRSSYERGLVLVRGRSQGGGAHGGRSSFEGLPAHVYTGR